MIRPSFQFYPADWRNNAKLRRCSEAERGAWLDILCVLHDSDEYGICRWPLADLARSAGVPIKLAKGLSEKDVLKGNDSGIESYIYTPRHAGKDGEPHTLIEATNNPCWYSSRLVRDEWVRLRRGSGTRFDSNENQPNKKPTRTPKPPLGERQGDGPISSSSSSTSVSPDGDTPLPPKGGFGDGAENGKGLLPTTEQAKRMAAIMHRKLTSPWQPKEVKAYKALGTIPEEDLAAVERYYAANWPPNRDANILRHDLATLLNNWQGEVGRANSRQMAPKKENAYQGELTSL